MILLLYPCHVSWGWWKQTTAVLNHIQQSMIHMCVLTAYIICMYMMQVTTLSQPWFYQVCTTAGGASTCSICIYTPCISRCVSPSLVWGHTRIISYDTMYVPRKNPLYFHLVKSSVKCRPWLVDLCACIPLIVHSTLYIIHNTTCCILLYMYAPWMNMRKF